jgi:hypothetical protein
LGLLNGFLAETEAGDRDDVLEKDTHGEASVLDVIAKGLGDRVGDEEIGEGDGVLAKGLSGMWPTDFRRLGEWILLFEAW